MTQPDKLTKDIYNPYTSANNTPDFLGIVRHNGWLIDQYRGTEYQVKEWLNNYTGTEINPKLHRVYSDMIKKYNQ